MITIKEMIIDTPHDFSRVECQRKASVTFKVRAKLHEI